MTQALPKPITYEEFIDNNLIVSPTLPQLNLTAQQIFDSAL
ncbi:hypothetical protein [Nostoc sp.]